MADDGRYDQDEARAAVESGAILPLETNPRPAQRTPARRDRQSEAGTRARRWVYEFRVIDPQGHWREIAVDAATGAITDAGGRLMRVLLVEDDDRIASDVAHALPAAGYVVQRARNGEDAWFLGDTEDYVAIVLDLGLPGMDGLAVLKRWRENGRATPVLVLTARGSWSEKVEGIDAGADDYLAKPFRMEELLARLRSIIRRSAGHASSVASVGELTLDDRAMKVSLGGAPVDLSPLEYRLLAYLMLHRGPRRATAGVARKCLRTGRAIVERRRGPGRPRPPQARRQLDRNAARLRLSDAGVSDVKRRSLRLRLAFAGALAICLALAAAGAG